jgi:hypothetical protein
MSEFSQTWELTRKRFDDTVAGLTQEQLNWRLHPQSLTIGDMAIHVAGVEASFIAQLQERTLDEMGERLRLAATDGVINENSFPYTPDEITPEFVEAALALGRELTGSLIFNPSQAIRERQVKSALGPIFNGDGAFARLSYHPGYHQGQAHLIKSAPGFPGS